MRTFVPELAGWFAAVDALVCMGGYNTLLEALVRGTPTVCVPRTAPRSEQLIRARVLAGRGLLQVLEPARLDGRTLRAAVTSALARVADGDRSCGTKGSRLRRCGCRGREPAFRGRAERRTGGAMTGGRRLGYVLKRFPRISETFVAAELIELERQGEQVAVFAISRPEEPFVHEFLSRLRAPVVYLPHRPLREPMRVARALVSAIRRSPRGWLSAAAAALSTPRQLRGWRRLLQATVLREELDRAGIDHVHAHFATAAARLANLAHLMDGPPYSVTAHAKDIYHRQRAAASAAAEARRCGVRGDRQRGEPRPPGRSARGPRPGGGRPELRRSAPAGSAERRGPPTRPRPGGCPPGGEEGPRAPGRGVRPARRPRHRGAPGDRRRRPAASATRARGGAHGRRRRLPRRAPAGARAADLPPRSGRVPAVHGRLHAATGTGCRRHCSRRWRWERRSSRRVWAASPSSSSTSRPGCSCRSEIRRPSPTPSSGCWRIPASRRRSPRVAGRTSRRPSRWSGA